MRTGTAYFDFDDTIIHGDSVLYWNRFLFQEVPRLRWLFFFHWIGIGLLALRLIKGHSLKRWLLAPTAYLSPLERDSLAQRFGREVLPFHAFPEMLDKIRQHKAQGHRVVVLSASADFYLGHMADWLPADEVYGSRMCFPEKGWWRLPTYETCNFKGPQKVVHLDADPHRYPKTEARWGYSDHHSDSPLLHWVDHPFCIAPNRKLRKVALAQNWPVIRPFYPRRKLRSKRDRLERLALLLFSWI